MTTEQMQYFLVTAQLMNMTEASRTLYVAQSTLSRQIALLEKEVGTPLFARYGGKLQLTEGGKHFLAGIKDVYGIIHHLIDTTRTLPANAAKSITIGIIEGHLHDLGLLPALERFAAKLPEVDYFVEFHSGSELRTALSNGRFDVLLGEKELVYENGAPLCIHSLGSVRQKILMHRTHPLAGKEVLSAQDVERLEFVMPASISKNSLSLTDETWLPTGAKVVKIASSYDSQMTYVATNRAVALSYGGFWMHQAYPDLCFKDFIGSHEKDIVLCYRPERDGPVLRCLLSCFEPLNL